MKKTQSKMMAILWLGPFGVIMGSLQANFYWGPMYPQIKHNHGESSKQLRNQETSRIWWKFSAKKRCRFNNQIKVIRMTLL